MEQFKRQQIVDTAMRIFKEKGYFAASMQDIAEACGMAKASIYKIFPSKEDLFTGVFVEVHRTLFEEARTLERTLRLEGHSPKESLRRKIEYQLQFMLENYFFTREFKDLPITSNENFLIEWRKKRTTLLTMHLDCFREAYGEPIVPYLGDAVAIFRGMLREYLSHSVQAAISVPMSDLARFLVDRMEAIVGNLIASGAEPVLQASNAYFNDISPLSDEARQASLEDFLNAVVLKIKELPRPAHIREELQEVVGLLQRELGQSKPNSTLVRVYITFLDTIGDLRPYTNQLVLMLNQPAMQH